MVELFKTIDGKIQPVEEYQNDVWINMTAPTPDEINEVVSRTGVEEEFLLAALDDEETSRIEAEDNQKLIIIDIPMQQKENDGVIYMTIPLGIILLEKSIITVCLKDSAIIKELSDGFVKGVFTNLKTRFVFQLLYRVAVRYLQYLKQIDKLSNFVERQLHRSMKNKELIQLLELEKSLVFFSTSLKADEMTLEKILRGRFIKLYDEDQELLEDVLIEIKQAIEMSNIYSSILSGTMDAFASVISNNLNIVMKVLTSITILMAIPTMVASFYGMNVIGLPIPNFWIVLGIIRPVRFLLRLQALNARLDHTQLLEIHRIKPQLLILTPACHTISTDRQCTRKNMTAVIVGMFSDQIHSARRKINLRTVCSSKKFPKFC